MTAGSHVADRFVAVVASETVAVWVEGSWMKVGSESEGAGRVLEAQLADLNCSISLVTRHSAAGTAVFRKGRGIHWNLKYLASIAGTELFLNCPLIPKWYSHLLPTFDASEAKETSGNEDRGMIGCELTKDLGVHYCVVLLWFVQSLRDRQSWFATACFAHQVLLPCH